MQSFSCKCPERKKPVSSRQWVVWKYKARCSAFDGYREMPSDWSTLYCKACGACGRTKAAYVSDLRHETPTESLTK